MNTTLEYDGETQEFDDTPTEEEAAKDVETVVMKWKEYTDSVRMQLALKVKCQHLMEDLINSSLSITEHEDGLGTSYTCLSINSGALTLDWEELFEAETTKQQALIACLVYASIFIPAMVVKSYRILSATNLLKLVSAQSIRVDWKALIRTQANYEIECAERGNKILRLQGEPFKKKFTGMVDATDQTDEHQVRKRHGPTDDVQRENGQVLHGRENGGLVADSGTDSVVHGRNADVILLLCDHRAFTEADAMEVLARTPEGIEFICSKQYADRIKSYIHISRILVFQESIKQRFERAKAKYERDNESIFNDEYLEMANNAVKNILIQNGINEEVFAVNTYMHFTNKSKKKNNLFFYGAPSTGKTIIMTSLVEAQFNYCRLTGLTPNSSFNFSGLLHCNACLMDECKLTENQFEQWKLLASGMPMSTDVK